MTEWQTLRLGDVCELKRGYDLPTDRRKSGPVPIVSSSGLTGWHDESKVCGPGVVTGRYGTLGEVFYIKEDFWPLNTALYVRDFRGNNPRFVYYLLKTTNLVGSEGAAAVPGVNRNVLHELHVRRPGLSGQERIADVLAGFDELTENNRRRIEILEESARSLYREWFVHFRFPGRESATFTDSPLGSVPLGWSVSQLNELRAPTKNGIASGPFGSKLGRRDYVEVGVPVIRGANLALGGGFTFDRFVFVSPAKVRELSSSLAGPGDVVVTQRGTIGQVGLIPQQSPFDEFVLSQSQMKITVDPDVAEAHYIYAVLCSDEGRARLVSRTMTSGVPHINLALFKQFDVVLPPLRVQREFRGEVEPLQGLGTDLLFQNRALQRARDELLPKLVTGAIDVESLGVDDVFGWAGLAAEVG